MTLLETGGFATFFNNVFSSEQHLREIAMLMFGKHFGGEKQRLRKKRCFNVPNIVPTFVPIGNYYPIIFAKGEVDRDYRTRGLATSSHHIALSV
jgi:hypothetical protein